MKLEDFKEQIVKKIRSEQTKENHKKIKPYLVTGEYKFKLDWKLKEDLDILANDLKQNDDALIIIVAPEGSGKTVLETQIGYYLSRINKSSWGVNNVHFDGQNYIDFSLNSPQYTIVCLDESRRALNKMRGMTGGNVEFNNFLSECRSQNQIHIVVLPAFNDLEKYVAIHRVKYLIKVDKERDKETRKIIRGNYKIISTKSKAKLLEAWKGGYKEFPKDMVVKNCKFENVLCLDEKKYKKKKEDAKKERYSSKEQKEDKIDPIDKLILEKRKSGLSMEKIASHLNLGKTTIFRKLKKYEDKNVPSSTE